MPRKSIAFHPRSEPPLEASESPQVATPTLTLWSAAAKDFRAASFQGSNASNLSVFQTTSLLGLVVYRIYETDSTNKSLTKQIRLLM